MKRHLFELLGGWWFAFAIQSGAAPALPPGPAGLPPILSKILGDSMVFSAKADVQVKGKTPPGSMQIRMDFFYSRANMRVEINMADVKSDGLREEMLQSLKQIGMDRVVTILRPGSQPAWILYPNLKATLEISAPDAPPPGHSEKESLQEIRLGEETLGGQSCEKCRVVYQDNRSHTYEALVWRNRDSRRFPRQIQMTHADTTMVVSYSDVRFAEVSPSLFVLPPDYTRYESMEKVMQEAVKRLLTSP